MKRIFRTFWLLPLLLAILTSCSSLRGARDTSGSDTENGESDEKDDGPKEFSEVIKDDFEKDEGLFTVYKDKTTYYFDIPDEQLGKEFLMVTRIAKTATNLNWGGAKTNTQTLRWVRQGDNILLRVVGYTNVADEEEPIYEAVRNSNVEPIIHSFKIAAINEDTTVVVIDVTKLFMSDIPSLGLPKFYRTTYKITSLDTDRSYISSLRSFPTNIEVRHVMTYEATAAPSNSATNSITVEMSHSMIALPEIPMKPRLCDRRVGYFSLTLTDYSSEKHEADSKCYITRWRLEPKDKEAYLRGELVEPVKQIVYYIDSATPEKWRPFLIAGVNDWNRAFEAAGFKNAIRGANAPTAEEDPEFDPDDARYSVIRYLASNVPNASGPHVHDPRTGEILESDIRWYHNVQRLLRDWYLTQTAAANSESRTVQFEDEVMGELLRFVAAHEVGHTLGFQHNMGSSHAFPVDSLRSPTFTSSHGTAPSIMDYARMNYIAQPGDGVTQFMPRLGTYDDWATKWGYTWFEDEATPKEERETLDAWTVSHAGDPNYWFGSNFSDPRVQTEDLGDDAMRASDYGIENLKVVLANIKDWSAEDGKPYDDLQVLYNNVTAQYNRYIGHVSNNIGGLYQDLKTYDQDGVVYSFVPREIQMRAMKWMQDQVFTPPTWLVHGDVLRRIEGVGMVERMRRYQVGGANRLLDPQKMYRLMEAEIQHGTDTFTMADLFSGLRTGIFGNLRGGDEIGIYNRNLQRGYIERLQYLMENEPPSPPAAFAAAFGLTRTNIGQSDIRPYVRGELEAIKTQLDRAATRTSHNLTRLHLVDLSARIEKVLDKDG